MNSTECGFKWLDDHPRHKPPHVCVKPDGHAREVRPSDHRCTCDAETYSCDDD